MCPVVSVEAVCVKH